MRTRNLILTAAISAGGLCLLPTISSAQTAGQRIGNAVERTEDAVKRTTDRLTSTTNPANALAPDAEDIRETLRSATEASLTKGGFDDLVERFVDADRNRLGKDGFAGQNHDTLDGRISQFQKDWKAKYNQDFKIKDKEAVYSAAFATIIQSEVPGSARMASDRVGGTNVTPPVGTQQNADANQAARDAGKVGGGDTNLNPGRNIATVQIAASHGLPALSVPLIHELPDSWRIDVPDNYTVQQMHENLLKHLTMADDMKDQWPADVNEAYRVVTHHVFMAVLNIDQSGSNMSPMPGRATGMTNGSSTPMPNSTPAGAR